jgi:hypothetical protein
VADPIAELCVGDAFVWREDAILKLYPRTPGDDWKNYPTHTRLTSNPDENIAEFRPGGLKRLEMLLSLNFGRNLFSSRPKTVYLNAIEGSVFNPDSGLTE